MTEKLTLKERAVRGYRSIVGVAGALILSLQPVLADDIWSRFSTIMKDVYGELVGISTIVAVTAAAVALLIRMISRNQRAVDEATRWPCVRPPPTPANTGISAASSSACVMIGCGVNG